MFSTCSQFTRRSSTRSSTRSSKKPVASLNDFVRRSGGFTGKTSSSSAAAMGGQPLSQGQFKYVRAQDYMREKDLEYGYAKMQQGDRVRSVSKIGVCAEPEKVYRLLTPLFFAHFLFVIAFDPFLDLTSTA